MYSTKMMEDIAELKAKYNRPVSMIEVARDSIARQIASLQNVDMPPILSEEQRKVFMGKIDMLAGFLETQEGADAIELLIDAFEHYCAKLYEQEKDITPAEPPPVDEVVTDGM